MRISDWSSDVCSSDLGPAYLAQLTGSGAAIIGARDFADQVYELALLRALIGVGRDLVEQALDTSEEVNPLTQIEAPESARSEERREGTECVSTCRPRGSPYH